MADGYISQIKTPDNKVYDFRDQHLKVYTGSCTTEAATVIKDVTTDGEFTLAKGAVIFVNFSATNTAAVADLKLRVNSSTNTDAKPIKHQYNASEANLPGVGYIRANQTYVFYYDGTNWIMITNYNSNDNTLTRQQIDTTRTGKYSLLQSYYTIGTATSTTARTTYRSDNIYAEPSSGTIFATAFSGSGASLTSLNASNLSSGTVPVVRLPLATTGAAGAVKIGSGISVSDGTISVTAANLGLSKAMRFLGTATATITDGGTEDPKVGGSATTVAAGDVVIDKDTAREYVWSTTEKWELLGGDSSYKTLQDEVNDPTAATTTSTTFIDTISQNTNGVITATKKTLPTATKAIAGITKVGAIGGAAEYSHTHSYLANTNKGAENRPIYITGNTATECDYMFPIYYKALDFSSTAPIPGAYPINNETNPATNTTGWYGSALSLPGINASTKHYAAQVFIGSQSGADKPVHMYVRRLTSSPAWSGWSTVLDNENYNSYAPTLTGNGASGTWNINISGSAGSVAWANVSSRPTNVSSFTNDAGYLTNYTETDPTVPAWAKAASKPSYTASEVGALASSTVVTNVAISANVTTNANYPIIFATSDKDTTAPKDEGLQKNGAKFYFNPHTGNVVSTLFNNLTLTAATTGFTIAGGTTSKTLTVAGTVTINTPTQWGIVYGGASGTYTSTAAGTSGQYLKSNGNAAPTWATFSASTVGLSNVTNDAQIPKSIGTTKGDIIYFDGNASPKRLAIGTNGEVLKIVSGIPSWETDNNDDTKNTAGSTNFDSKLYLIGAASQAANPQTYSDAHVFETNGAFSAKTLGVNADTDDDKVTLQWNSTDNSLDFVFA